MKLIVFNKLIFAGVLTALVAAVFLSSGHQIRAVEGVVTPSAAFVSRNYTIKLRHNNPAVLNEYGTNVQRQFEFAKNAQFKNIYSFSSPAGLDFLKEKLKGQYEYLDIDQPIIAQVETELRSQELTVTPLPVGAIANDPGFTSDSTNIEGQWALPKVGFTHVWHRTTGSPAVVVAIIDTGIDQTHIDLRSTNFVQGYDFISELNLFPGRNSDDNGHGTLVAGIIAATQNNSEGITGAAPGVTLMPLKALNSRGSGRSLQVSEAIVWAADRGASIINMSLGGLGFAHDTTLANAITYAYRKNVLIVAAAGNDAAVTGGNLDNDPVFPVCDDNGENMVLGVTATDQHDLKPQFANYGKACIDVSAPGRWILSTINRDPANNQPVPNAYLYASGTSMSTPYVTAQAALIKSLNPGATNYQLRDRIITTADKIDELNLSQCGGSSCRGLLGAGRINVAASVAQEIPSAVREGDVVQLQTNGALYHISGGKRRLISPFVKSQRFASIVPRSVAMSEIEKFPEGPYAEPLDGTIIKLANEPTVYYMLNGLRRPLTFQVFQLYGLNFASVQTLSYTEVSSWIVGSLLAPPDGTLVRTQRNPTVYWVVDNTLHPINYGFYIEKQLNIFPVVYVSETDLKSFSQGEAYIR
jgi:subtilisin family serine protease